jgi:hypothetical protein
MGTRHFSRPWQMVLVLLPLLLQLLRFPQWSLFRDCTGDSSTLRDCIFSGFHAKYPKKNIRTKSDSWNIVVNSAYIEPFFFWEVYPPVIKHGKFTI